MGKYSSALKGKYKPKNPEKWLNDDITYRSGLEKKYFTYFDNNPNILKIASEKVIIPYFDPLQQKYRRYYVDLYIKYINKNGEVNHKLIEIKCNNEVIKPKPPKRLTESYKNSLETWIINQEKWKAAKQFAKKRGWEFSVYSELHLK